MEPAPRQFLGTIGEHLEDDVGDLLGCDAVESLQTGEEVGADAVGRQRQGSLLGERSARRPRGDHRMTEPLLGVGEGRAYDLGHRPLGLAQPHPLVSQQFLQVGGATLQVGPLFAEQADLLAVAVDLVEQVVDPASQRVQFRGRHTRCRCGGLHRCRSHGDWCGRRRRDWRCEVAPPRVEHHRTGPAGCGHGRDRWSRRGGGRRGHGRCGRLERRDLLRLGRFHGSGSGRLQGDRRLAGRYQPRRPAAQQADRHGRFLVVIDVEQAQSPLGSGCGEPGSDHLAAGEERTQVVEVVPGDLVASDHHGHQRVQEQFGGLFPHLPDLGQHHVPHPMGRECCGGGHGQGADVEP